MTTEQDTQQTSNQKATGLGSYRRFEAQQPQVLIPLMLLFVVLAVLDVLSFGVAIALIVVLTVVAFVDAGSQKQQHQKSNQAIE